MAAGLSAFGHDLLTAMGDDAAGNAVVSPLSIGYAFGMTDAGARGRTATQIEQTLHFPAGNQHEALNAILQRIGAQQTAPNKTPPRRAGDIEPPIVAIANGLFVQRDFEVRQEFLRILAEQYGAGARAVDFEGDTATGPINDWVREQTADRISKLFDSLDPITRLVLANAVYLKASWATQFTPAATKDEVFHRSGGDVRAPMMHTEASVRYAAGDGWQAVELPYARSDLAMWVLVPSDSSAPRDLLAPEVVKSVGDRLAPERVKIAMPRWDFASEIELAAPLQKLGMTDAFSDSAADFTGIAGGRGDLIIHEAVHRANITVDEAGTEAAAVTGVVIGFTSAPPPARITVRADHPFAFAIVHKPTRTPLFVGQVADPTAR
jgi:serine protease inhibitor